MPRNRKRQFTHDDQAILTTILYSDIFDFPLNAQEIKRFLVAIIYEDALMRALATLVNDNILTEKEGYYCLSGRESIITKRILNRTEVTKKLRLAQKAAFVLSKIPTIQFIGISGGLAVHNVTKDDDIDFFIIVSQKTLFFSRFLILFLLECMGIRRKRIASRVHADKICVNLLIDETAQIWSKNQHNLYIAHEIAQVLPVFDAHETYKKFITSNAWVSSYLPYALDNKLMPMLRTTSILRSFLNKFLSALSVEIVFRYLQMLLINRHQTSERVTDTHLGFHPNDYETKTLEQLRLKIRQLGLLTKF